MRPYATGVSGLELLVYEKLLEFRTLPSLSSTGLIKTTLMACFIQDTESSHQMLEAEAAGLVASVAVLPDLQLEAEDAGLFYQTCSCATRPAA